MDVVAGMARNCDAALFSLMLVMMMASARLHVTATIRFDKLDQVSNLHWIILLAYRCGMSVLHAPGAARSGSLDACAAPSARRCVPWSLPRPSCRSLRAVRNRPA